MTEAATAAEPRRRRWPIAAIGAAGVLVVGLTGGAWALRETSQTCHGAPMVIGVAVQPDVGPAVRKVAARFNVQTHEVRGRCVRVEVAERDPATVARTFAGQAVAAQGVRPAVDGWLPESWIWIYLARSTPAGAARVPFGGDSVAASPLVLAASAGTAEELRQRKVAKSWDLLLKGRADTLTLSRRMLDPAASAVGMTTLLAAHTVDSAALPGFVGTMESRAALTAPAMFTDLATLTRDQRSLMASTEQQIVAYNDAHRANPAVALVPGEGTFNLNYPFLVTATDPARKEAAEAFRATLLSRAAQDTFQSFGFRVPRGTLNADTARRHGLGAAAPGQLVLADPAKGVVSAIRQWHRLAPRLRLLVLMDASGSMGRQAAGGRTRLQLAAQALRTGLRLLPDGTQAGLWSVATVPPGGAGGAAGGGAPYRELVPLTPLGGGKGNATGGSAADRIGSAASRIRPRASAGTGLYDAVPAAYRTLGQGATADRGADPTDVVLVLTDGDDDTVRLRGLYDALRAQQNPRRPVRIVTVAFGPEGAGSDQLRRVGELTGGGLYSIGDPARLGVPFEQALAPHLCTPACTASSP